MMDDDDIIDLMLEIISLTGEYVHQSDVGDIEYSEETEKKYRKLVISAYIYVRNLEELLKGGEPPKPPQGI
jgi:hypothetical protein